MVDRSPAKPASRRKFLVCGGAAVASVAVASKFADSLALTGQVEVAAPIGNEDTEMRYYVFASDPRAGQPGFQTMPG